MKLKLKGMLMMRFELLLILLCCVILSTGNKYSEHSNLYDLDDPFRIMKVNLLWQKAKQYLPAKKLADLHADLQLHDKREGDLKKAKVSGLDDNGLKTAQVEAKFMAIVQKYGLNTHYMFESQQPIHDEDISSKKHPQQEIKDPRLQELWTQASASGFTDNELKTLKQELSHHQMKIEEYESLKEEFQKYKDSENNEVEAPYFDIREVQKKNIDLKAKHKELKENLGRLQEMSTDPELATLDFSDLRVYQLWAMAKKSNMTETELNSLREELKHFEHRLKKQEHFQEQLSLSEKNLKNRPGEIPQNHAHLEQKVKDYDYKINKIHRDLRHRIKEAGLRHSEL